MTKSSSRSSPVPGASPLAVEAPGNVLPFALPCLRRLLFAFAPGCWPNSFASSSSRLFDPHELVPLLLLPSCSRSALSSFSHCASQSSSLLGLDFFRDATAGGFLAGGWLVEPSGTKIGAAAAEGCIFELSPSLPGYALVELASSATATNLMALDFGVCMSSRRLVSQGLAPDASELRGRIVGMRVGSTAGISAFIGCSLITAAVAAGRRISPLRIRLSMTSSLSSKCCKRSSRLPMRRSMCASRSTDALEDNGEPAG